MPEDGKVRRGGATRRRPMGHALCIDLRRSESGRLVWSEATAQLFNVVRGVTTMQHGVTVWAYRNEILDRVKSVRRLQTPKRAQVVYVNETLANLTVARLKVQLADRATGAVVFDALCSRPRVPLVAVY